MAYKITYGKGNEPLRICSRLEVNKDRRKIRAVISVIFCILCCVALVFELHRTFITMGKSEEIKHAISSLVDNLQQGENVGNAVSVFCEEILSGAES